tara:strand:+ start:4364 stop:4603 length:240 start_codon:yes stop_codon:yes gene_type:complete
MKTKKKKKEPMTYEEMESKRLSYKQMKKKGVLELSWLNSHDLFWGPDMEVIGVPETARFVRVKAVSYIDEYGTEVKVGE